MNYELIKKEFIKLKIEELDYIDDIAKISSKKILSEYEKLEIYRNLKKYEVKINEMYKKLFNEIFNTKKIERKNLNDVIIEFDINNNYLSSVKFNDDYHKKYILKDLGIDEENLKFKLTLSNIIPNAPKYESINSDIIQNNQKLIENTIYVFCGYYDYTEDCYGPRLGNLDDYLYGIYENIEDIPNAYGYGQKEEIPKKQMNDFEKDKIILHSSKYVYPTEIWKIFANELLNTQNKTLNDCIIKTKNKIEELNYTRSPEYKEKILLEKIKELYEKVKGELIKKEILYSGNFLNVLKETYKLPNENIVHKEKIIKNNGKNSVIVIAITQDKEYIITFQNRIKDKIIAEFPSGYIENNENPIEAAKRELQEETSYISEDLFIIDEVYTSPGIDNSITYIVVANNCVKTNDKNINGTELINYGLFSEKELEYLINKNIINGAMNKLAYYNLVNNVENINVTYIKSNKRIYKKPKEKTNPLNN